MARYITNKDGRKIAVRLSMRQYRQMRMESEALRMENRILRISAMDSSPAKLTGAFPLYQLN